MKKRYESKRKYHYFYEIRNNINNHFYYGIHSTDNMEDGYMGSGKRLNYAYKKYGIDNFTKTILKEFSTREEAATYEAEVVTETLVKDSNCYNCTLGGDRVASTLGKVVCQDKETGEWVTILQEEYHNNKNKYKMPTKGLVYFKDKNGKTKVLTKEEYHKNKEKGLLNDAQISTKGKVVVKDKNGKYFAVNKNDSRYLNGELAMFWEGRKHNDESKKKMSQAHKGKHIGINNSNYGKSWITKNGENKTVPREDLEKWFADGWTKGRYCKNSRYDIEKNQIIKLRDRGLKWIDIAKEMGVKVKTIYKLKNEYNIS